MGVLRDSVLAADAPHFCDGLTVEVLAANPTSAEFQLFLHPTVGQLLATVLSFVVLRVGAQDKMRNAFGAPWTDCTSGNGQLDA